MQDKPLTTDPEQRANDTRSSRYQSGLPPEPPEETPKQTDRGAQHGRENDEASQ